MGAGIVMTSLLLLFREQWVLTHTQKGQKLVMRFGDSAAVWIYRGILAVTAVFGGLLAGGVIRPIQWGFHERGDHRPKSNILASRAAFATPSSSSDSAV